MLLSGCVPACEWPADLQVSEHNPGLRQRLACLCEAAADDLAAYTAAALQCFWAAPAAAPAFSAVQASLRA